MRVSNIGITGPFYHLQTKTMAKLWPSGPDAQWWQQGIGSSNSLSDHLLKHLKTLKLSTCLLLSGGRVHSAYAFQTFSAGRQGRQRERASQRHWESNRNRDVSILQQAKAALCIGCPGMMMNDGHPTAIPLQSHTLRTWFVYCTQAPLPQADNSSLCPARKCVTKLLLKPELLRQVCSYDVSNPTSFTQTLRVKPQSRCPHSPAGKRGPLCWLSSATLYVQITETKTPIVKTKISQGSSLLLHNQHLHPAASFHALFGDFMRSNLPPLHWFGPTVNFVQFGQNSKRLWI